jgi:hypothetical protein
MMNQHATLLNVTLSSCLLACSAGAGTLAPVSQERTLSCFAEAGDDDSGQYDSDASMAGAPDFAPFSAGVSAYVDFGDALGSGGGSQTSYMNSLEISASGSSFATGEGWSDFAYGSGAGDSYFEYVFELAEETDVVFDIYLVAYDSGYGEVTLFRGSTPVIAEYAAGLSTEIDITYEETLSAGQYIMRARASGSAFGGPFFPDYAFSEYSTSLRVDSGPCPGDVDGDGDTDQPDLARLLAAYGVSDAGDLDGDGDTDQADLGILLTDYGCIG